MLTQNSMFSPLFVDEQIGALFGEKAIADHFLSFEQALTEAFVQTGLANSQAGELALKGYKTFQPDFAALGQASLKDGLPVPAYVKQLKAHIGEEGATAVHIGATSQDLIDTAMMLAVQQANIILAQRLKDLISALEKLDQEFGSNKMMGRTRMQAALPIFVSHRIGSWLNPLKELAEALGPLRSKTEILQLGSPVGDRGQFGDKSVEISAYMANALGLNDLQGAWHNTRLPVTNYGHWLASITGALGKMGQDMTLMAQQDIEQLMLSGGGKSSAMAHKDNPILAETLVSFARFNATQISALHHAVVHEQERSGAAWSLEWIVLPQMVNGAGKGLSLATLLVEQVESLGEAS